MQVSPGLRRPRWKFSGRKIRVVSLGKEGCSPKLQSDFCGLRRPATVPIIVKNVMAMQRSLGNRFWRNFSTLRIVIYFRASSHSDPHCVRGPKALIDPYRKVIVSFPMSKLFRLITYCVKNTLSIGNDFASSRKSEYFMLFLFVCF